MLDCHGEAEQAEETARRYLPQYFLSVVKHYEFSGTHVGQTKGYQAYDEGARMTAKLASRRRPLPMPKPSPGVQPDQIVEKLAAQEAVMGDLDINIAFSDARLPFDQVEDSFTLFSTEVLPALRELSRAGRRGRDQSVLRRARREGRCRTSNTPRWMTPRPDGRNRTRRRQ